MLHFEDLFVAGSGQLDRSSGSLLGRLRESIQDIDSAPKFGYVENAVFPVHVNADLLHSGRDSISSVSNRLDQARSAPVLVRIRLAAGPPSRMSELCRDCYLSTRQV